MKESQEQIRKYIIRSFLAAKRGHVPSALSIADILNVLYGSFLNISPRTVDDPDRDRFILSKGHGCLALYATLAYYDFISSEELDTFCQFDSRLGGHPGPNKFPGCEAGSGSLGHGASIGTGFALAAKLSQREYKTVVLMGDGECNEGSVWESCLSAGHRDLDNLIFLVDYNKYQSYGKVSEVLKLEPFSSKFKSFGLDVYEVDMQRPESLLDVLTVCSKDLNGRPKTIICHTVKGSGVSFMESDLSWHHKSRLTSEELKLLEEIIK